MLVLYDMCTVMLRSCMRLLEPKLQLAIDAGAQPLHDRSRTHRCDTGHARTARTSARACRPAARRHRASAQPAGGAPLPAGVNREGVNREGVNRV